MISGKGLTKDRLITFSYVIVFILAVLASYMGFNIVAEQEYYTADPLWQEDFVRDFVKRGLGVRDWAMTGMGVFPSLFVYGLISYTTGSIYVAYVGLGLVYIVSYVVLIYLILGLLTELTLKDKVRFSLLTVTAMMLAAFWLRRSGFFYDVQFFTFVNRGSTMLNATISILMALLWLKNTKNSFVWLFLLLIFAVLGSITDRVYELVYLIPSLGAIVALALLRRVSLSSAVQYGGMVIIADLVGQKIVHWAMPLQMVGYSKISLLDGWAPIFDLHRPFFSQGWYYWFVLISYVCIACVFVYAYVKALKAQRKQPIGIINRNEFHDKAKIYLLALATFALPSVFAAMALIVRPGTYNGSANVLVLSFWLFLLVLTPYGLRLWKAKWLHIAILTFLTWQLIHLASSNSGSLLDSLRPTYLRSNFSECLDEHKSELGDGAGIADYWAARPINLLSQKGIQVYQAQGSDLLLYLWNGNSDVLKDRKYTFIIADIDSSTPAMRSVDIIKSQGEPDAKLMCGGLPVLIYRKGIKGVRMLQDPIAN